MAVEGAKGIYSMDLSALDRAIALYIQGVPVNTISNQEPTILIFSPPGDTLLYAFML